jgi:ribonuclease E/ribonuclease G
MMTIDEILITVLPGDRRAAALARGRLVRLALSGPEDEVRVGDIILGRIKKVVGSIGCAFVDLGSGPEGLLMTADAPNARSLAEGEGILCQVLRQAIGVKGPKLTARLPSPNDSGREMQAGARPPYRLARGPDPILSLLRDAATAGARRVVVDDGRELSRLRGAMPKLADKLEAWLEPAPLFAAHGVDEAIEAALEPIVLLPSGGRLTIEETEALVAIDVDTGTAWGDASKSSALACDLEAAAGIGPEIVARDLAGIIVIDFVPLRRQGDRARVLEALRKSLAGDDRQLRVSGWTRLGLVELRRERRGPSLSRRLTANCTACGGRARAISPRWLAGNALRALLAEARETPANPLSLALAPEVLEQLRGPLADAAAEVESKLGGRIELMEADSLPAGGFRLPSPAPGAR